MTRREALQMMGSGFGTLGLAHTLMAKSAGGPLAAKTPHFPPKAKRVIFLFLNGGISQVDTFDPKPDLGQVRWPAIAGSEDPNRQSFGEPDGFPFPVQQ